MKGRGMMLFSAAVIVFTTACAIWAAVQIPEGAVVAVHWNIAGRPDGWAHRNVAILYLFLVPALTILLAGTFAVLPRIEPRRQNLIRSRRAYVPIWIVVLALQVVIEGVLAVGMAGGHYVPWVPNAIVAAAGGLFVVTGNYMGKLRSNFFVGIRTPWTLSSELSWKRTHRLGGRLMVVIGLATILSAPWIAAAVWVLVGGALVLVGVTLAYSYRVWAGDPAKQPVGRTPAI